MAFRENQSLRINGRRYRVIGAGEVRLSTLAATQTITIMREPDQPEDDLTLGQEVREADAALAKYGVYCKPFRPLAERIEELGERLMNPSRRKAHSQQGDKFA